MVCGTGLKECILSGLLSMSGKKVLHIDRNDYYGAESASLTLSSLFEKFRPGESPPKSWGTDYFWNVDLIPKFVMAAGNLVTMLVKTKVSEYLEWKPIEGTYVYQFQEAGWFSGPAFVHKVPASPKEALESPLMSFMEKSRCQSFFQFVAGWEPDRPETQNGMDPETQTMADVYAAFGLCEDTMDFIGHAVALYTDDEYLSKPCGPTLAKIQLYMNSISMYGRSPFIYPLYGLGGLPEGFARRSAVHQGTFMLGRSVEGFDYDEDGKVCAVRCSEGVAKCKMVICDPSYASSSKTRPAGRVVRAICILNAPIPSTSNSMSCQVIIPQRQLQRQSDIFIMMISWEHNIAYRDKFVAIVSTMVETEDPEQEIKPALDLLGEIEDQFVSVTELCVPTDDGSQDGVYVTQSYDATSHFEDATSEVLRMWRTIVGEELDLTIPPEDEAGPEELTGEDLPMLCVPPSDACGDVASDGPAAAVPASTTEGQ